MMPEKTELKTFKKPNITLLAAEHDRLSALADAAAQSDPEAADMLAEELERARVVNRLHAPKNIVRMGSDVLFRDDTTKEIRRVSLVFPNEADISRNKVSVLTPIGAALIGLRAGQSIAWRTRNGETRRLTVLKVTNDDEPIAAAPEMAALSRA
ncbi:MAG: nucleoside diphosphate kinase regulator [Alphaproteobacteria bacterium]